MRWRCAEPKGLLCRLPNFCRRNGCYDVCEIGPDWRQWPEPACPNHGGGGGGQADAPRHREALPRRFGALAAALLLALVAGGLLAAPGAGVVSAQDGTDYDTDDDGLIEITTLAQLDAIRWDLNGDGTVDADENAADYNRAFPGRNATAPNINGCDADGDGSPNPNVCTGYELMADLDFDENCDGKMTKAGDPTYWNGGAGWTPIGGLQHANWAAVNASDYSATFEGNGRGISNLYINRTIDNNVEYNVVGLFAGVSGTIRNVDLLNPQISITRSGAMGSSSANRHTAVGGLAGYLLPGSRVDGSRIVGGAVTFTQGAGTFSRSYIGCLTGDNYGAGNRVAIIGSFADCAVTANVPLAIEPPEMQRTSDPKDSNHARVGGLVGSGWYLDITASYAAGAVSCRDRGSKSCGGLVGDLIVAGNIVSSYATGNVVNEFDVPSFEGPTITTCTSRWGIHYSAYTGALVGLITGGGITDSYATGRVTSGLGDANSLTTTAGARFPQNRVGGLVGWSVATDGISVGSITNSYWDSDTTGFGYIGFGRCDQANDGIRTEGAHTTEQLQMPTDYGATSSDRYYQWNRDVDNADGDNDPTTGVDDPWDFGAASDYPKLKYGRLAEPFEAPGCTPVERAVAEEEEYVTPPIVYNLNIRFSVRGLTLDEGESGSYRVRMTQAPAGHPARVTIRSNNSDVVVSPTELVFSSADYDEWQTVAVNVLRDPNDTDENAYLTHRGPRLSYGGLIVTVNDVWPATTTETVNGHTITVRNTASAPLGVAVTAPATLDRDTEVTVSGAPSDTPQSASGYGLGEAAEARMAASIRVNGAPADGLNICLPLPAALATEAGDRALTLLRYAGDDGGWTPVSGAQRRGDAVCADGVTEYGVFAAAYVIPDALGTPANLAAVPGAAAGSVVLTWTPAAYAARHFVFGIKQSDAVAGDTSNLAAWTFAERPNVHTVTGLESGATYYFTVTAGRADADGNNEWSPWAPWVVVVAPE